jgi:sugar phosphate permease
MSVSLPLLIESNLIGNVTVLGFFNSMSAIGFVVGALGMGSLKKIRNRGWLAYIATFLAGLMTCIFGIVTSIPALAVAAFFDGFFICNYSLVWTNTLQELVSRDNLDRVASIDALGSYVLLPIGYGIYGWATDLIGAPIVFVIGGGLTAFLVLIGLSNSSVRGLN